MLKTGTEKKKQELEHPPESQLAIGKWISMQKKRWQRKKMIVWQERRRDFNQTDTALVLPNL